MENFLIQNGDMVLRLLLAMVLGMIIGAERLLVHKEAGMKTHALVAMGAALFMVVSEEIVKRYTGLNGVDPSRIASQIIVGIGFLGAGSIIFHRNRLTGLTTAGGLWVTAGIGMAVGFGLYGIAITATIFTLFVFFVLVFVERPIREMSDKNPDLLSSKESSKNN